MDVKNPALVIATVDAAAIIAVGAYSGVKINELRKDVEKISSNIQQISTYVRANIDPKALVGLGERLAEYDGHVDRLDPLDARVEKLEAIIDAQNHRLDIQHSMIQALIDALDRVSIEYDVPENVAVEDGSRPLDERKRQSSGNLKGPGSHLTSPPSSFPIWRESPNSHRDWVSKGDSSRHPPSGTPSPPSHLARSEFQNPPRRETPKPSTLSERKGTDTRITSPELRSSHEMKQPTKSPGRVSQPANPPLLPSPLPGPELDEEEDIAAVVAAASGKT